MSNKQQMVTGFNHNIKHGGQIYHVQTEDSGISNPHIITHLFVGGNILATKKTSYADIVKADNLQDIVRELMQEQHKAMLRNLINGVYDDIASASAPALSPNMQVGAEPPIPDKFPVPPQQPDKPSSTEPSLPVATQPAAVQPAMESTASTLLPKSVPTPVKKTQPVTPTKQTQPAQSQAVGLQASTTEALSEAPTVLIPRMDGPRPNTSEPGIHKHAPTATDSRPKSSIKTTGSAGGFSRPKTSPKIFVPKEEPEKVPPNKSPKPRVAIQANGNEKPQKQQRSPVSAKSSAHLPPEVLAARRLSEKPKPKDTSGPTIFGENLISEKSLDEVILGYLAGNDDDKG